ncbi:hypothetical protein J1N35_038506 [Gossypium stocksii]|uniref:Reverse transcriptase n=1 Tax=Gossypium stocksii TaxID=47602 RepID=A0A9D3UM35_9ROSI|nr:hypothetical protein J1N35_038506 [Gossypium stocksii]
MLKEENGEEEWRFTGFYGSPYVNNKSCSWNLLRKLGQYKNHPWLVSGDFNEIMYSFEKSGGILREESRMEAFREALEECQLEDLGYSGVWFTWERGNLSETNIRERFDRGVVNDKWRQLFPTGNIQHLPHSMSYHYPLLLNTKSGNNYVGNPKFKFKAWWIMEETLEKEIKASWESISGTIVEKLERLQVDLKVWVRSIKKGREGLKNKLTKELDMLMAQKRTDETMAKIANTKVYLNMEIDKDKVYWEQRARANWLKVRGKNSAFFHRLGRRSAGRCYHFGAREATSCGRHTDTSRGERPRHAAATRGG